MTDDEAGIRRIEELTVKQVWVGFRPYILVQVAADGTYSVDAGGGSARQYLSAMRAAIRSIRRAERAQRRAVRGKQ